MRINRILGSFILLGMMYSSCGARPYVYDDPALAQYFAEADARLNDPVRIAEGIDSTYAALDADDSDLYASQPAIHSDLSAAEPKAAELKAPYPGFGGQRLRSELYNLREMQCRYFIDPEHIGTRNGPAVYFDLVEQDNPPTAKLICANGSIRVVCKDSDGFDNIILDYPRLEDFAEESRVRMGDRVRIKLEHGVLHHATEPVSLACQRLVPDKSSD